MSKNGSVSRGDIGFLGALFLVFLVLRLTGAVDWSWWWVTSPLWISAVVVTSVVFVLLIVAAISRK